MRVFRNVAAAAAALVALAVAGQALATCTSPGLVVIDGAGATQTTAALACPTILYTEHVILGEDGTGALHPVATDASGNVIESNFPAAVATGAGASGASVIRVEPTSSFAADGGGAKEAGGHLAAIDTSTAAGSTAANQTAVQANAGADASKGVAVQGVTGMKPLTVTQSLAQVETITGSLTLGSSSAYTAGVDIGGVITVATGLGAAAPVCVQAVDFLITTTGSITTGVSLDYVVLGSSPTGTFTDGSTEAWTLADGARRIISATQASSAVQILGNAEILVSTGLGPYVERCGVTDGSGDLYLVLGSTGTPVYTATATMNWRLQLRH